MSIQKSHMGCPALKKGSKKLGVRTVSLNSNAKKNTGKTGIKNHCNQWKTITSKYLSWTKLPLKYTLSALQTQVA